jgi:hypothetical protein
MIILYQFLFTWFFTFSVLIGVILGIGGTVLNIIWTIYSFLTGHDSWKKFTKRSLLYFGLFVLCAVLYGFSMMIISHIGINPDNVLIEHNYVGIAGAVAGYLTFGCLFFRLLDRFDIV